MYLHYDPSIKDTIRKAVFEHLSEPTREDYKNVVAQIIACKTFTQKSMDVDELVEKAIIARKVRLRFCMISMNFCLCINPDTLVFPAHTFPICSSCSLPLLPFLCLLLNFVSSPSLFSHYHFLPPDSLTEMLDRYSKNLGKLLTGENYFRGERVLWTEGKYIKSERMSVGQKVRQRLG